MTSATSATPFVIPGGWTVPVLALTVVMWLLAHTEAPEAIGLAILSALISFVYILRRPAAR